MRNDRQSRRIFLANTAAATAGAIALGHLPASASAFVGGDDVIKIALIGCGGRGTGAASQALNVKQNVQLVAMADAFKDRLDESYNNLLANPDIKDRVKVKDENKFVGFEGYKKAIALADVVLLATPPAFRPLHLETAVAQGKHVFMEKPVAVDPAGINKVLASIAEAKKKKLSVTVGLQRRFNYVYTKGTIEKLQEGLIGDIVAATSYWNIGFIREPMLKAPGMTEMEYQMRNWYHFAWLSGDHIEDTHIHNLDIVNWVKQAYPVQAQGSGGRSVPYAKDKYGSIFDHHFVEFTYADGCVLTSQCRQTNNCWVKLGEQFVGTKGRAETDTKRAILKDYSGNTLFQYRDRDDPNSQDIQHSLFFEAIAKGQAMNDAEYGAYSTMTAILGRMASYSGQVVTWEDAMNSDMSIVPENPNWDTMPPIKPLEDGSYPLPMPGVTPPF